MLNGFVKIHRKLIQWGWYQDNVVKGVFLHLLLTASFRESEWMGRTIKKGQVVTSNARLAKDLGFSIKQVRTALNKLKSTGEVAIEGTNRYTLVTIVNWEEYQVLEDGRASEKASDAANKGQTEGKQGANKGQHLKKVKEGKEGKELRRGRSDRPPLPDGVSSYEEWDRIKAERRR